MQQLSKSVHNTVSRPVRIMQFGEGNFLRAFCDYFIQEFNDSGKICSNVVVVQPVPMGRVDALREQDGLYTVYLQGFQNGEAVRTRKVIDVLSDFINPYTEYERFLKYAETEELELIISNTTEAGIVLDSTDTDFSTCPKSYPGKLLAFLHRRYTHFMGDRAKSLIIVPCELIDYNGRELRRVLIELARVCGFSEDFIGFIESCEFNSTLVDRIVPGYPAATIKEVQAECGYIDNNVVVGEIFALWALENGKRLQEFFKNCQSDKMIFTEDITPFKQQKVKILNGSHTAIVPIAYLMGIDTVREAVENPAVSNYLNGLIYREIVPTINLPKDVVMAFADSVIERFLNPYVRHELMSIALNSTAKFATRLLPSIKDYVAATGELPKRLVFALAALITFFKGFRGGERIDIKDSADNLAFWAETFINRTPAEVAEHVCKCGIFGEDLSMVHEDFVAQLSEYLEVIEKDGAGCVERVMQNA